MKSASDFPRTTSRLLGPSPLQLQIQARIKRGRFPKGSLLIRLSATHDQSVYGPLAVAYTEVRLPGLLRGKLHSAIVRAMNPRSGSASLAVTKLLHLIGHGERAAAPGASRRGSLPPARHPDQRRLQQWEPTRRVDAAWLYSPMRLRQDRDTTARDRALSRGREQALGRGVKRRFRVRVACWLAWLRCAQLVVGLLGVLSCSGWFSLLSVVLSRSFLSSLSASLAL